MSEPLASSPAGALVREREAAPARNLVAELVEQNFAQVEGELLVGGVPIGEMAARFGTPLFVYDLALVDRQIERLRSTLPRRFDICYSVKANPAQALLRHFVCRGCGLEIASSGELRQALAAGCDPAQILFAGPGKTEQELAQALDSHIGELHVESLVEARRIAQLAEERKMRARVALRVNPSAAVAGGGMRMGAKPAPFGIDEDQLADVVREVLAMPALEIVGLHLFVGTQILDAALLAAQYRAGIEIARRLAAQIGRPLSTIDFGGGWGVPYFPHERALDCERLRGELAALDKEVSGAVEFQSTRFVVEPGRFLVAEAGLYLARVNDVKVSRGKKFLITDGGMHHHLAASGNLGQTIKRNFPVSLANKLDAPPSETVDVVGPLCTPLDVLARGVDLPVAAVGDLVGVFQSGAYARTASPLGFLSRPAPPEVVVAGGEARLIRRRGRDEDFLVDQADDCLSEDS